MSENEAPRHSEGCPELIPKDHAEAMWRIEAVRTLEPAALAGLEKQELLLTWWSFCWIEAALHPDDAEGWPKDVAAETCRRYETGKIEDGEYHLAEAVRDRILNERAKVSQAQSQQHQKAETSET